jgi:predicted O-methyltransferase YrrM
MNYRRSGKPFKTFKTKFDLVFIDADHSEEAVSKDIKNYLPLLRNKNSILAGHDLSWESVRNAIIKTLPDSYRVSHNNDNFWWISKELLLNLKKPTVATAIEETPF